MITDDMIAELEIYVLDGQRVIAAADDTGRMIASLVLGGDRADADAAVPAGLAVGQLTDEQMRHYRQHGWCDVIDRSATHYQEDMQMITDAMIAELCAITTRDTAGRHFTAVSEYWPALEEAGLIKVHRPIHPDTGLPYSDEYWSLEVTEDGQTMVDAHPELHPSI